MTFRNVSPILHMQTLTLCYPATKGVALVLSFSQILLISEPALECVDESTECSPHPTIQITAEIT